MTDGLTATDCCLLIGYGNDLRADDAVGRHVARGVASWRLPEVKVLERVQLTPELADDMSRFEMVVFVDADAGARQVHLEELKPLATSASMTHHCSPARLLVLSKRLYGRAPRVFSLGLPVASFALSEDLSVRAQQSVSKALSLLKAFFSAKQKVA